MTERKPPEKTKSPAQVAASCDGISIACETKGAGWPALVFVHGWSCDRTYWDAQVQAFSRRHQVVTIDLAGHGESGGGRAEWTIASFGEDVAAVARQLELDSMILIGHSMGGDVILEAAKRLPGCVRGLVWVDTYRQLPSVSSPQEVRAKLVAFRMDFVSTTRTFVRAMFHPQADANLVERVVFDMSTAPPEIGIGAAYSAWTYGPEVEGILRELNLPLVAINPDMSAAEIESLERYGIRVTCMSGVGHFPMMEDPQLFNECLDRAIQEWTP